MESLVHLEKSKGTLRVLAHINGKGNTRISDIIRDTGLSSNTTYVIMRKLMEMELVSEELSGEFPSKKSYTLTEEGQEIANHIEAMGDVLTDLEKKVINRQRKGLICP